MKNDVSDRERESYEDSQPVFDASGGFRPTVPEIGNAWNDRLTRRKFLKRTGGATAATLLAVHAMKVEVQAAVSSLVKTKTYTSYSYCVLGGGYSLDTAIDPNQNNFFNNAASAEEIAQHIIDGDAGYPPMPAIPALDPPRMSHFAPSVLVSSTPRSGSANLVSISVASSFSALGKPTFPGSAFYTPVIQVTFIVTFHYDDEA